MTARRVPRVQELRIDWIGPSMNQLFARAHWRKRNELKEFAYLAALAGARAAKIKPVDYPVDLIFRALVARSRRKPTPFWYDTSNYSATGKMIEDGLVKAKVLIDDTPEWVRFVGWHPAEWTEEKQGFIKLQLVEVLT